jgi:hypothetical protein
MGEKLPTDYSRFAKAPLTPRDRCVELCVLGCLVWSDMAVELHRSHFAAQQAADIDDFRVDIQTDAMATYPSH